MKCKDCAHCYKGWFDYKPNDYVCIGVKEPFVISDINVECTEYKTATIAKPVYRKNVPYMDEDGIYVPVHEYTEDGVCSNFRQIISKELFVEAFNKWISTCNEEPVNTDITPLPCPFCGNTDVEVITAYDLNFGSRSDILVCCPAWDDGCGACGGIRDCKEEAIEAWNRRCQYEMF